MKTLSAILVLALGGFASPGQEKPAEQTSPMCPAHYQPEASGEKSHHEGVVRRGDDVMGFSHEKTTHHFILLKDGGVRSKLA